MYNRVYTGRPKLGSKTDIEEKCFDLLDSLDISYIRLEHESLFSMDALRPVEEILECTIAKNLFLTNRQGTAFYLLLMPSKKPFKTKYLSSQLECSRLSFASEDQLMKHLGTAPGSASVLGLLQDRERTVKLIIDKELAESNWFACHPCLNTSTVRFPFSDLTGKLLPALGYQPFWVSLPCESEMENDL